MGMLIYSVVFGVAVWIMWRKVSNEPIIPWAKKTPKKTTGNKKNPPSSTKNKTKGKKNSGYEEEEPQIFEELLDELEEVTEHMFRLRNNEFVLVAEVSPVNYYLLSDHEQESIDAEVERWFAQVDHPKLYFQNRYIDYTEAIEEIQKNMTTQDDLPPAAYQYGVNMLEDLATFQATSPMYETKRYVIFNYKVKTSEIEADTDEELEDKILEKAFKENYRKLNTAKASLSKAKIQLDLLTTEGLIGLLYYTFNRKKAVKHRFKDVVDHEKLANYVTAYQSSHRIELVKEMIENGDLEPQEEKTAS